MKRRSDKSRVAGIFLGIVVILVSGCEPQYQTKTVFVPPLTSTGQACVRACSATKQYCEQRSSEEKSGCELAAHHRALAQFKEYESLYDANSAKTEKTADDFYDDSACQLMVPCSQAYNQCFIQCGGSLHNDKICVSNCPEPSAAANKSSSN